MTAQRQSETVLECHLGFSAGTARIDLVGALDECGAEILAAYLERAGDADVDRIVLNVANVGVVSAAAVRCLAHAQQRFGPSTWLMLAGADADLRGALRRASLDSAIALVPDS
ncbi:hypothetical protein HUO13_16435 [Saccharopolyspora erythraea]|uniref:hypothetical protein n=1 Tax=Saccharopolyspora erythraea TaxID=1836 RepID=UPI001BA47564|nr:hypothetical protein [Saccharopolyspora erythraea]QUH02171.1 hypothetical protein HUO13_16435 [Saccharopolyspora erythraea]